MAGFVICTALGNNPRAYFRLQPGSMDADDFISLLKEVKKELGKRKLLLIWDGLPAHKAKAVQAYIASESRWLRVERYPGYAPELSPVEFIWAPIKGKDLAHAPPKGLRHLKTIVRRSFRRIKADPLLLKNCLRKAGVLS